MKQSFLFFSIVTLLICTSISRGAEYKTNDENIYNIPRDTDVHSLNDDQLAHDTDFAQRVLLTLRKKSPKSVHVLNYMFQTWNVFLRYYLGRCVYEFTKSHYTKINPIDANSSYSFSLTGLQLMTLFSAWRNAIDWQNSWGKTHHVSVYETAHILGFMSAIFAHLPSKLTS